MSVSQLFNSMTTAKAEWKRTTDEYIDAVKAASPHKVGEEFERNGKRFKVERIFANSVRGGEGGMVCVWWTTANKWSRQTQNFPYKAEG